MQFVSQPIRHTTVLLVIVIGVPMVTLTITGTLNEVRCGEAAETRRPGDPARGRDLFNGKGSCSVCHGIDGDRNRPPLMTPNTARRIAELDPSPANFRATGTLKLKTDIERFDAIRHGHLYSRMDPVPEKVLSDRDIEDLLAYLASLRGEAIRQAVP